MTNFEPLKDKIWEAAQKSDKTMFDDCCTKLMQKACDDWWRIGWSICPQDIDEVLKMIDSLAENAHTSWLKAIESGDAPNEDISPGEGFALCAKLIREEMEKNK